jgi:hypothetical protein
MKRTILFFIALLFAASVFGQEEEKVKKLVFFNEYSISVNRTNMNLSGTENRFGGGASMYFSLAMVRHLDIMVGLEYNYTSLFRENMPFMGHRHEENITFHIHTVSLVPVAFRFNIGKNVKYFLETGLPLGTSFVNKTGTMFYINPLPTPENPDNYLPAKPHREIGLNGNLFFGMGVRIPMKGIEWVIKADYNVGISRIAGYENYQYYRLGVGIRKRK